MLRFHQWPKAVRLERNTDCLWQNYNRDSKRGIGRPIGVRLYHLGLWLTRNGKGPWNPAPDDGMVPPMPLLRRIAQKIRHLPWLERQDAIWNALRAPYHRAISAGGNGASVNLAGHIAIRMPPTYTGMEWETYEPDTVRAALAWIRANPDGRFLDIGSAIGIFSLLALTAGNAMDVVAFDADLPSLIATRRMCQFGKGGQLRLIYGLVSDRTETPSSLDKAAAQTEATLDASGLTGDFGTTQFVCLPSGDAKDRAAIPYHTLDALFAGEDGHRPTLIKSDIEGAEIFMLEGAKDMIRRMRPAMLISVHPEAIVADYGRSVQDVANLLKELGYRHTVLAVDHEEHWWCEPADR